MNELMKEDYRLDAVSKGNGTEAARLTTKLGRVLINALRLL
jgi:hypothetical protein